ncbi:hypothetical protein [Paenibacillus sp. R14(2021)]|uniref:hypothetical protein n=1 Tax=Paenibacillus sp. R14(2021) TaxID=2859228 RepID=UPI001C614E2F|nr:hypothetical protein [Paenibacillus sp. R14(2021)]
MSVAAIILEPKDTDFYVPVATESFFQRAWVPAIKELNLELLLLLNPGLDLTKKDLSPLIQELEKIKSWAEAKLHKDELDYLKRRIDSLKVKLIEAFNNGAITIFIG